MNLEKLKEFFPAEDIEWRIGQAGKNDNGIWAKALAYISARAIQDRLDEAVGPQNWAVEYKFISASEFTTPGIVCKLKIKIGDEWVEKEDGAESTDMEPFKGGISSALKRAGSAWGIGRYLYKLDADFAEISETRKPGFEYAHQKKDNLKFYWRPKPLPAWALPKKKEDPKQPPQTKNETAKPLPPKEEPKAANKSFSFEEAKKFKITEGFNAGKTMGEVPEQVLRTLVDHYGKAKQLTQEQLDSVTCAKLVLSKAKTKQMNGNA